MAADRPEIFGIADKVVSSDSQSHLRKIEFPNLAKIGNIL
jgi:hypothetical protein